MAVRREDRYDVDIFENEETYSYFLLESTRQFSRMKYGNKATVISTLKEDIGIEVADRSTYDDLIDLMPEHSKDFFKDVLNKESKEDVAHSYAFYKFLIDVLWETSWTKQFGPFYEILTGESPDIKNKSEKREYAEKVILNHDESALVEAWREFTNISPWFSAVGHYNHLTVGPLGLAFSRYPREKGIINLGAPTPPLDFITSVRDNGLFDRDSSDFVKVFSTLLNSLKDEIALLQAEDHLYWRYWITVELDQMIDVIDGYRNNISILSKKFEQQIVDNEIIPFYWILSQLSTMMFKDEDIVEILNKLIAQEALVVAREEDLNRNLKTTTHGIIIKPNTWRSQAAFELAEDIATLQTGGGEYDEEIFGETLRSLVGTGPLEYLDDMLRNELDLFKELMRNKNIYGFDDKERYEIPGDKAKRILLETYGVILPAETHSAYIADLATYLSELADFRANYRDLDEGAFIQQTIRFLQNGRTHIERFLKEFFFLLSALIMYYVENRGEGDTEGVLAPSEPIFSINPYGEAREIQQLKEDYKTFLSELSDHVGHSTKQHIDQFLERGTVDFTLYDWHQLVKASLKYLQETDVAQENFWSILPEEFSNETQETLDQIDSVLIDNGFRLLNMASHEEGRRKIRASSDARNQAVDLLIKLHEQLKLFYTYLPDLVRITEEREEVETGVTSFSVTYNSFDGEGSRTIYGSRIRNTTFTYFAIPLLPEDKDFIYPILITNLVDVIF